MPPNNLAQEQLQPIGLPVLKQRIRRPLFTTSPRSKNTTWSATWRASPISCATHTIVMPSCAKLGSRCCLSRGQAATSNPMHRNPPMNHQHDLDGLRRARSSERRGADTPAFPAPLHDRCPYVRRSVWTLPTMRYVPGSPPESLRRATNAPVAPTGIIHTPARGPCRPHSGLCRPGRVMSQ